MSQDIMENQKVVENIRKVCAILIRENRLLVVKSDKHAEYLPVGGKIEQNESLEDALIREVQEEIGISVSKFKFLLETPAEPALGKPGKTVTAFCFLIYSDQEISINNEIRELIWISKADFEDKKVKISSILEKFILPKVIELGLLK
jgi:8-oxo-dGTP pyrophosphatase MutT (NUDIX family)